MNHPLPPIDPVKLSALIEEQELTKADLLTYLRQMSEIRALEEQISRLLTKAVLKGASHLYAGEEAVAVGAVAALRDDDLITSTHRGHGHGHAHGDSAAKTDEEKQAHYNKMMAEVLGKSGGYCKGKGGSMHIADVQHGNLGATGIVGGNLPVAVGAALAQKLKGTDRVVVCFFGDGASNEGNFHEALNMASAFDLPVIFVAENNQYGMSVPWANVTKLPDIADRACAYGMPGVVVDGMDVRPGAGCGRGSRRARAQGRGPDADRGEDLPLVRPQPLGQPGVSHARRRGGMEGPRSARGHQGPALRPEDGAGRRDRGGGADRRGEAGQGHGIRGGFA